MVRKNSDTRWQSLRPFEQKNPFHLERGLRMLPQLLRDFRVTAGHGRVQSLLQLSLGWAGTGRDHPRRSFDRQHLQE